MRDILATIRRNFFQPIVIAILILAGTLLLFGDRRDAWFVSFVIMVNTIFAIVQELRAQFALKKLELMNAPRARRLNSDGTTEDILFKELQVGDTIDIRLGDEIPADGEIVTSQGLEVNESLLTGESASIQKESTAIVYASSSVVAGSAIVRVTAVGEDSRVGTISSELKRYVPQPTPLQRSIATLIAIMTYGALALAALIFTVYFFAGQDPITIVKTITSAAVTVVPEGLLLASTLLLAFGSLKLAQAKVLPQKLGAIEAMALLDVLCVDKTGTLTSDSIQFDHLELTKHSPAATKELLGIVALETSGGNATGDAMIAGLPAPTERYEVKDHLAFSSERKYSGLRVTFRSHTYTLLVGAPEFVSTLAPLSEDEKRFIELQTKSGKRVLLAALFTDNKISLRELKPGTGKPIASIVLENGLRPNVEETIAYLQKQNVTIKVISGDSPATVQSIAERVGIHGTQQVITGAELASFSDDEWERKVPAMTIFARVLPEQKERLVQTFRNEGLFTGMVGDGVNDALALKKSDLGVAMFAGAVASRRVADIVLLNNSFTALPLGMKLGNRIMLSIEMIATLFFHKIIYGVILLLTTLALGVVYPFEPRHITFMNIFLVTLPTILWTLFTPRPTYKISPKRFWWDTLLPILPISIISGLTVALSYVRLRATHPEDQAGVATTTVLIATFFGVYAVFLVSKMFRVVQNRTTRLAQTLYILCVLFVLSVSFGFGLARDFFSFTAPAWRDMWSLILMIPIAILLQWLIADRVSRTKQTDSQITTLSR